jgi:hypothetical protein
MVVAVRKRRWFGTAGTLTLAFVALALVLCAFGGDHDTPIAHHQGTAAGTPTGHGAPAGGAHTMSPDLCMGLLLASAVVLLLVGLLPGQWLRLQPQPVPCRISPARLDHPPRFRS